MTVSDNIRHKLVDQTLFEERCIKRVAEYISKCDSNINNRKYIERLINQVASVVIARNKREYAELFSDMATEDSEGDEMEYEPVDVLADVESDVIAKEMTALLAQDGRRKTIVEAWLLGNTNGRHISRTLARTLGGNEESHRKFIQRFEKECQQRLADVI